MRTEWCDSFDLARLSSLLHGFLRTMTSLTIAEDEFNDLQQRDDISTAFDAEAIAVSGGCW